MVVGRLAISEGRSTGENTEVFAKALMNRWSVGKSCDNGILLLLATDDRQVYIATGKGAKDALPSSVLATVIQRMRPKLRIGAFSEALEHAVYDIGQLLGGKPPEALQQERNQVDYGIIFAIILLLVVLYFCNQGVHAAARARTERYRQCTNVLKRLDREWAEKRAAEYKQTSCAICLEELEPQILRDQKPKHVLLCGHTFHRECIDEWMAHSAECPLCRSVDGQSEEEMAKAEADRMSQAEYRFRVER